MTEATAVDQRVAAREPADRARHYLGVDDPLTDYAWGCAQYLVLERILIRLQHGTPPAYEDSFRGAAKTLDEAIEALDLDDGVFGEAVEINEALWKEAPIEWRVENLYAIAGRIGQERGATLFAALVAGAMYVCQWAMHETAGDPGQA